MALVPSKLSKEFLRNNPPPNSTKKQLDSWYKKIDSMEEEKKESQAWLLVKTLAWFGFTGYIIYTIFF